MAIKAIIFDFDGLIIDTETPEVEAWHELFQRYNVAFSFKEYSETIGKVYDDTSALDILQSKLGTPIDKVELFKEFKQRKVELIDAQPLRSGVRELLESAQSAGMKTALASSARRAWVERYLSMHRIGDYFCCIKTLEDSNLPKPDPALYLLTLESLGIRADEAIALEDSFNGITAAKAAGVFAVAVPNRMTCDFDFSQADLRLEHLTDLSLQELIDKFERV